MSAIFTGDFQSEWKNLDLCSQAWDEVLHIASRRLLDRIVFLGDGKQQYNPIDGRVVEFWQHAIGKAIRQGKEVLWNEGNHDRFGRYEGSGSWLSILKKAGAIVFNKPGVHDTGNERYFFLPYSSDSVAVENAKSLLSSSPNKATDILVFHQELKGVRFNQQGSISDGKLTANSIRAKYYRYCISGHIHLPQEKANVYYAGSPFCMDWGEVNQRKRYLVLRDNKISSVDSQIPGWYDPDVSGFPNRSDIKDWRGTKIRITKSCDASKDYGRTIERVRKKAERKYKGANILVVPKFKDEIRDTRGIRISDSDDRKIKEYVRRTYKDRSDRKERVVQYMLDTLANHASGLRGKETIKFRSAIGRAFLPFGKIKIDFDKGIHTIQGINKDRQNKSNGSGKTSLVQIVPVAMFGRTFKEQAHDKWANTKLIKKTATAEINVEDYKGRQIKITRGRRPPLLQMKINGKEQSSGMKTTDRLGTQAQIEQVTGFTWQTLANAIYIDRSISDAFLSGTKKQRTEVLSRFQNLERFDKALKKVREDASTAQDKLNTVTSQSAKLQGEILQAETALQNVKQLSKVQINDAHKEYSKHKKRYKQYKRKTSKSRKKYRGQVELLTKKFKAQGVIEDTINHVFDMASGNYKHLKDELEDDRGLVHRPTCPTCYQDVEEHWVKELLKSKKKKLHELKRVMHKALEKRTKAKNTLTNYELKIESINRKDNKLVNKLSDLLFRASHAKRQWMELSSDSSSAKLLVKDTSKRVKYLNNKEKEYSYIISRYKRKLRMYEYAADAFSRDGIPAFLNRELCPVLNKAADYYAELFSDREIQLRFVMDEGEFVPMVINAKGGDSINDQSTGERAIAGLIASFALREVAPRSNLLILDEPGDGLDEATARQFARALQGMKKRFGSIWITSHNDHILSELSGETMVTVVKENGISRIKLN